MTANTYILQQVGYIKNKPSREFFLKTMLEEDKTMEFRCNSVMSNLWWLSGGPDGSESQYYDSDVVTMVLSALLYMHTSKLGETLCVIGTFLDNLEWPKEGRASQKEMQAGIISLFTHGIISGLVTAMNQYTRDLSESSPIALEKRVAIFIVELLYRQALLELDVPDYQGRIKNESRRVHDFGDAMKQYLLPSSKFVEKNLRPKLFAKEMQKRKFEKVTCKPAKQVLDQILQTSFSAIEDYNLRTALVCRGLR